MADDFQRRSSSSRKSSAREDKPESRSSSHREEGSANGKGGGGEGGGGGGVAKKKFGLPQDLAVGALIISLFAVGLSIWCSLLWWDWPFVITIPALSLALAAVVLAFVAPKHVDAILCCSVIGFIFGLAGLIWCAVEIGFCHSYQGPLKIKYDEFKLKLDALPGEYTKAKHYYDEYGPKCNGECYDWWYQKEMFIMNAECKQASEKWFLDKHFKKGVGYGNCQFDDAYDSVDSYHASPIYLTHKAIADNNKVYPDSGLWSKSTLKAELKKICKDFDKNVKKFLKNREKCDKKLKKNFEPKCVNDRHGIYFTKGKVGDQRDIDDCYKKEKEGTAGCNNNNDNEYAQVYCDSKYVKVGAEFLPEGKADVTKSFSTCKPTAQVILTPNNHHTPDNTEWGKDRTPDNTEWSKYKTPDNTKSSKHKTPDFTEPGGGLLTHKKPDNVLMKPGKPMKPIHIG